MVLEFQENHVFNYLKKNNDVEIFDDDETLKNKKIEFFFPVATKSKKKHL